MADKGNNFYTNNNNNNNNDGDRKKSSSKKCDICGSHIHKHELIGGGAFCFNKKMLCSACVMGICTTYGNKVKGLVGLIGYDIKTLEMQLNELKGHFGAYKTPVDIDEDDDDERSSDRVFIADDDEDSDVMAEYRRRKEKKDKKKEKKFKKSRYLDLEAAEDDEDNFTSCIHGFVSKRNGKKTRCNLCHPSNNNNNN